MENNQDYQDAIETTDRNLRTIACAGSGKTTFIARRVAFLLSDGIKPENIIAFTYTEKAAAELYSKIVTELKKKELLSSTANFADMYIGTIHGWCLRMLLDTEIGYQNFTVLEDVQVRLFIDKHFKKIGISKIKKLANENIGMKIFTDTERFMGLMNVIRESRSPKAELPSSIQTASDNYEGLLKAKKYFDFSMILNEAMRKLEDPNSSLRKTVSANTKYLIVDEYQDVNPIQNQIIHEIHNVSRCYVTVVGDDDQNIFNWRGSNNRYIQEFDEEFSDIHEVDDFKLEHNYRSSRGITGLASKFIMLNKNRISKSMRSKEKQEFSLGEDILYEEHETEEQENENIAQRIEEMIGVPFSTGGSERGLSYSDFCILLRTWRKSKKIAEVLSKNNIPFVTAGVNELFETAEVEAAVSIFHYLNQTVDKDNLKKKWLGACDNMIDEIKLEVAIARLERWIPTEFQRSRKSVSWGDYVLQEIFWEFLANAEIAEDVIAGNLGDKSRKEKAEIVFYNLGKFSQVINDYEAIYLASAEPNYYLFNFLNFIKYTASGYYPEGWTNSTFKAPNAVQILTVHQAKGLEFPVVFIPGLNRNYFPLKKHGGLTLWHFLDKESIQDYERYLPEMEEHIENERRLLYVALTRSQKYLFVSRAPEDGKLYKRKSQFVNELESEYMERPQGRIVFAKGVRIEPVQEIENSSIVLNFSMLKDFFECKYRFKLNTMYGFCAPINQRMGFGKSMHNSLMAIHKRMAEGEELCDENVERIAEMQMHFPYIASSTQLAEMQEKVKETAKQYYQRNKNDLGRIEYVEQEIILNMEHNITVTGRIDLIKRREYDGTEKTTIMELKSKDTVQSDTTTIEQLNLYALGYRDLIGKNPDYIQVYNIESNMPEHRLSVSDKIMTKTREKITSAASNIRGQELSRVDEIDTCKGCHQRQLCIARILLGIR